MPNTPSTISILINNFCNFECDYCEFDSRSAGKSLDVKTIEKVLKQSSEAGIKRVHYDGGEPLMHKDFEEILRLSKKYGFDIGLITNGWFVPDKFDMIKKYGVNKLWISMVGMDEQTHDSIRKSGSFRRAMESIRLAKKEGMYVGINYIVLKPNYKHLPKLAEFVKSENIDGLLITALNKYAGRAQKHAELWLNPDKESETKELVRKHFSELEGVWFRTPYFSDSRAFGNCKYLDSNHMSVDWDGNLQLCALFPGIGPKYPNLADMDMKDAMEELERINKRFQEARKMDYPYWRPEDIYSDCGYCLERLRLDDGRFDETNYKSLDGDLLLTTACPVECDFCIYGANPKGEWMPENLIRKLAKQYTEMDIGVRICGGEPFMDFDKLRKCLDIVLEYQSPHEVLVITSGFFGSDRAKKGVKILTDRELDMLVISTDRFHECAVPLASIQNIIDAAKGRLKIVIRFTSDERSHDLMERVAEFVVRNEVYVEFHPSFGSYGKAELLDGSLNQNTEERTRFFKEAVLRYADQFNKPAFLSHYMVQSAKRSQRKRNPKFYPTCFPNGNIYADSQCTRGTFMGNLNEKPLKELVEKFKDSLPGYMLLKDKGMCSKQMRSLFFGDECEYCRNHGDAGDEAIGRKNITMKPGSVPDIISSRELFVTIELTHDDLKPSQEVQEFVDSLKSVRHVMARPVPKCVAKYDGPKNCYGCRDLFSFRDGHFYSCKFIGVKGPKYDKSIDRQQLFELFNAERLKKPVNATCRKCRYYRRRQCDGLCYR